MQQKEKNTSQLSLDTIAKELAALAYDLANGKLRIGSSLISIGNPLFFKSKQKMKDGKAYFTLSFQVPLQDENENPTFTNSAGTEAKKVIKQEQGRSHTAEFTTGGAPEGKKLKKEIGKLWKSITKHIEQDQPPPRTEAEKLLRKCEDYNVFTDPPWQAEWTSCCEDVKKCLTAASQGDMATAKELVNTVNIATRSCHKKYK